MSLANISDSINRGFDECLVGLTITFGMGVKPTKRVQRTNIDLVAVAIDGDSSRVFGEPRAVAMNLAVSQDITASGSFLNSV